MEFHQKLQWAEVVEADIELVGITRQPKEEFLFRVRWRKPVASISHPGAGAVDP